jgi:hypothetical protein
MELIGEGRMAEVFAVDDEMVVKVDRPEFNGVALYEATIIREVGRSGLPVPDVIATTVVDGRHGLLLRRLRGPALSRSPKRSSSSTSRCTRPTRRAHPSSSLGSPRRSNEADCPTGRSLS